MIKKAILLLLTFIFSFSLVACGNDDKTIKVLATAIPHEEILIQAIPLLADKGYSLEIIVTDDYGIPNSAVANGSVDANFFQHIPFFNSYNNDPATTKRLVNVGGIHIEPIAGFSKRITSIGALNNGGNVLISTSESDHGRVLSILAQEGIITLKDGVDTLTARLADIETKPENLTFRQVAPELLTTTYQNENNIDIAFINGNFALSANLPDNQKVVIESPDNNPYVNIIAVLEGNETLPKIQALIEVLTSQTIKDYITNTYGGSVIPA
ncbi:MetQ/NlpA family ABC transporter substrate-binding protein [Acholeplasma laidlawii]|uniref:MetQ/NlpA family ABC transporter substrate-binding protein n=1 Tax=Acholeplasma laidlawii TaxID=2148 RepID=UPI0021F746AD|nr:MetQ/NlpA family ABC transporter substrate-binding protein [Acholeplasma laidlawii]